MLVVEHDRDDEDHDVGLARRGSAVGRRRQPTIAVGALNQLCEPRLLAHVGAALVDRVDDRLLDVHGDHAPAVRGELSGEGQSHLAGTDDGDRAGSPLFASPRRDAASRAMATGILRQDDRATEEAGPGRAGAADDRHAAVIVTRR